VNDGSGRALRECGRYKIMAVELLASERDKEIATANGSRIRRNLPDLALP
jgi:hypothetical protein